RYEWKKISGWNVWFMVCKCWIRKGGTGRSSIRSNESTSLFSYDPKSYSVNRPWRKANGWLNDDYVIFFSNSGSEANETAFKMARQYHQQKGEGGRHKLIARYRAYHGNTM